MNAKTYVIEEHTKYIRVLFRSGTRVDPDIILKAIDHLNARYGNQSRHDLWDFRGCVPSSDFGYDGMTRIVDALQSRPEGASVQKAALLVDDTILFGLSRMFQILADGYPTDIRIFQNETDARRWISREPESEEKEP